MNINEANASYESIEPRERLVKLFREIPADEILVTSSFGSTSFVLLHMISKIKPGHPIHFIDTTFHFKETLHYKEQLAEHLGLNIINVRAQGNKNRFTRENKTWQYNQDLCCFINKVDPLNHIKPHYKYWVSGLMTYQNANRRNIKVLHDKGAITKVHPLIDMSASDVALYQLVHELPNHPLTYSGYDSIGCSHCTKKGAGRSGRWANAQKTECGLHI